MVCGGRRTVQKAETGKDGQTVSCGLTEANFRDCNLAETVFANMNLMKDDFRGTKSYVISPQNNRVRKAKFSFSEVLSLLKYLEFEIE